MTKPLTITVSAEINTPTETAFDYIIPVELSRIFHPLLFLPGVVRTNETDHWSTAGLTRTVFFSDNSTAKEELLSVNRPSAFSYRISAFTGLNRMLIDHIIGQWTFATQAKGTAVLWSYTILPRNSVTRVLLLLSSPILRRYLHSALTILKQDLEIRL